MRKTPSIRYRTPLWLERRNALYFAVVVAALALAGCTGSNGQASKMTSFTTAESQANRAELFALPADQMSHLQIYTVAQSSLTRTLRLTGAVAYDNFLTTPVITQVGGPVSRIIAMPGEHVSAGQPLLFVASPDYSQLRSPSSMFPTSINCAWRDRVSGKRRLTDRWCASGRL
jgi:multidrug efflux pump subunit AcrA (membrane-fusion protein)